MPVLVYIENFDGTFKKSALEVISYGAELARALKTTAQVAVIGEAASEALAGLGAYGAERVIQVKNDQLKGFVNQAYGSLIATVATNINANVVVLSATFTGKSLAPRIAVKMKAALGGSVVSLPEINGSEFIVRRSAFSGKAWAIEKLSEENKVLTLVPNSFPVSEGGSRAEVVDFTYDVPATDLSTLVLDVVRNTERVSLPDAQRVVSAGRGMKGPEHWGLIEDLATALGAATACSKPVSDSGWRPHSEHVGQTGITISPNLYIAVGISGAIQHLAGVSSSKVIVVINKDPEAPFFKVADYGIVGDAFEVLPRLISAAKSLQN